MNKISQAKAITRQAFKEACVKFKCDVEDIRGCLGKFTQARTYFIKKCFSQDIPLLTIGNLLGGRTQEVIESYLAGRNGEVSWRFRHPIVPHRAKKIKSNSNV